MISSYAFFLFMALQYKHFVCDYPLQTPYMLEKSKPYPDFIIPLFLHSCTHMLGMFAVCVAFRLPYWIALADLVFHFSIDRIKAHPKIGGRYNPSNSMFWNLLGADQMAHHVISFALVYLALS